MRSREHGGLEGRANCAAPCNPTLAVRRREGCGQLLLNRGNFQPSPCRGANAAGFEFLARQMASVTSVLSSSVSIIHSAPTTPGTNPASRRVETRHAKCVRHKLRPNCEQILCAARQEQ